MSPFISNLFPANRIAKAVDNSFAKEIGQNITNQPEDPFAIKRINSDRAAEKFAGNEPEILFVSEYIVNDQHCGALLVWEKYYDATHYEVFKRNLFQAGSDFERILFLDVASLEEERNYFIGYIKNTLGFGELNADDIYIILDDMTKEDRIYEYKVIATMVPKSSFEVEYDLSLRSQNLLNKVELSPDSKSTLMDFAGINLGSEDLAWAISLVNPELKYFGRNALEKPIVSFLKPSVNSNDLFVYIPQNINHIMDLFKECISLFSMIDSISDLVAAIGGLPTEFRDSLLESIDEKKNVFSYEHFKESIRHKIPVFDLFLDIIQTKDANAIKKLSELDILIPSDRGSQSITSMEGLSKVFSFVDNMLISLMYAQETGTFSKIQEIIAGINKNVWDTAQIFHAGEDSLSEAIDEVRQQIEDGTLAATDEESALLGIETGQQQNEKDENGTGSPVAPGFRAV
jgi:hypothetical protein